MDQLPRTSGIYKIESVTNGKFYIGSAVSILRRSYEHFNTLKRSAHRNPYLQKHYNKYGKDDLMFSVVELCDN